MVTLIKIGGSLANTPKILIKLCEEIERIGKTHELVIIPGGSKFADVARIMDKDFNLSDIIAHKIAILGMDQFGYVLNNLIKNSYVIHQLDKIEKINKLKNIPVFLPSRFFFEKNPLENTWKITSDSISIYIAKQLKIHRVIITTNVDGIYNKDPNKFQSASLITKISAPDLNKFKLKTCVDEFLAKSIMNSKIKCFVANGRHPKRIKAIIKNKKTICTLIY